MNYDIGVLIEKLGLSVHSNKVHQVLKSYTQKVVPIVNEYSIYKQMNFIYDIPSVEYEYKEKLLKTAKPFIEQILYIYYENHKELPIVLISGYIGMQIIKVVAPYSFWYTYHPADIGKEVILVELNDEKIDIFKANLEYSCHQFDYEKIGEVLP